MYVRSSLLGFVMGKDTHNPTCNLMCHIGFQFNHRILLFYFNVLIIQWQDETLYDPWAYLSQLLPSYHTCFNLSRHFLNFVEETYIPHAFNITIVIAPSKYPIDSEVTIIRAVFASLSCSGITISLSPVPNQSPHHLPFPSKIHHQYGHYVS